MIQPLPAEKRPIDEAKPTFLGAIDSRSKLFQTNTPCNGLLLRADVHVLFDLGLISIDPESLTVVIAQSLRTTSYSDLQGAVVSVPKDPAARPSKQALQRHFGKSGL